MYVSWSTSTTPPKPVHEPETVPSNLFEVWLYLIAPLPNEAAVGRVLSRPVATNKAVDVLTLTVPVPNGVNTKLPFVSVAVIPLPSNLMLSTSIAPSTYNVVPSNLNAFESFNSPEAPANVTRPEIKSSTLREAKVDWPSTWNVPLTKALPVVVVLPSTVITWIF